MKTFNKFFAVFILLTFLYTVNPAQVKAQDGSVNFQVFYNNLSPYGQWIDYQNYGYAWVPSAGPDFVPYSTGGHWIWTDYGWTWASDYAWGWAPFHYGRWDYDNYYGWVWIPDNEWGPAWVSWRRSNGYYGWTPLSTGISYSAAISNYDPPADRWIFLQDRYMGRNDIHNYYGSRKNNPTYLRNSTVINNTYVDNNRHTTYISGPGREEVQKFTGRQIKPVTIRENSRPGQKLSNTQLNIYRPLISKTTNDKPARIAEKKDVKPIHERPFQNKNNSPALINTNTRQVPQLKQLQQQQQLPQQQKPQPVKQTKEPRQQQPQQQNKQQPIQQIRQQRQQLPQQQKTPPVQQIREPRQRQPQQQNKQQPVQQIRQQQPQQQKPQPVQQTREQRQPPPQQQKPQPVQQPKPVKKDGYTI